MKTITIDREYGSGGRAIGMYVAKKAGIPCYDTELLVEAGRKYGYDIGEMKYFDERHNGSLLYTLAAMANQFEYEEQQKKPYECFEALSRTIQQLHMEGPAVFIGRCADVILQDEKNMERVYIYSNDLKKREQRIMEVAGVTEREAELQLFQRDKERRGYYQFFTGKTWGDKYNYDLMLNSGQLDYETCGDIILGLASREK